MDLPKTLYRNHTEKFAKALTGTLFRTLTKKLAKDLPQTLYRNRTEKYAKTLMTGARPPPWTTTKSRTPRTAL